MSSVALSPPDRVEPKLDSIADLKTNVNNENHKLQSLLLDKGFLCRLQILYAGRDATQTAQWALERERRLAQHIRRVENLNYKVCLVGPTKAGKSTLLNAIVGQRMAPVEDMPSTVIPILVRAARSGGGDGRGKVTLSRKLVDVALGCCRELRDLPRTEAAQKTDMATLINEEAERSGNKGLRDFYGRLEQFQRALKEFREEDMAVVDIYSTIADYNKLFRLCGMVRQRLNADAGLDAGLEQRAPGEALVLPALRELYKLELEDFPIITVPFSWSEQQHGPPNAGTLDIVDSPGYEEETIFPEMEHMRGLVLSKDHSQLVVLVVNCAHLVLKEQSLKEVAREHRENLVVLGSKFDVMPQENDETQDQRKERLEVAMAWEYFQDPARANGQVHTQAKRVCCCSGYLAYMSAAMEMEIKKRGIKKVREALIKDYHGLSPILKGWCDKHNYGESVTDLEDRETIIQGEATLRLHLKQRTNDAKLKGFERLIHETLRYNASTMIIHRAAEEGENVMWDVNHDLESFLDYQNSVQKDLDLQERRNRVEISAMDACKEDWRVVMRTCCKAAQEALMKSFQEARSDLAQGVDQAFEDAEKEMDKGSGSWQKEHKINAGGKGGVRYTFQSRTAAKEFADEVAKHLNAKLKERLRPRVWVKEMMKQFEKFIGDADASYSKLPTTAQEALHLERPSFEQVQEEVIAALQLSKLEAAVGAAQARVRKHWVGVAWTVLYAVMSKFTAVDARARNGTYSLARSAVRRQFEESIAEPLGCMREEASAIIAKKFERMLDSMLGAAVDRTKRLQENFRAMERPITREAKEELEGDRRAFRDFLQQFRSIKARCAGRDMTVETFNSLRCCEEKRETLRSWLSCKPEMLQHKSNDEVGRIVDIVLAALDDQDGDCQDLANEVARVLLQSKVKRSCGERLVRALLQKMERANDETIARFLGDFLEKHDFDMLLKDLIISEVTRVIRSESHVSLQLKKILVFLVPGEHWKKDLKDITIGFLEEQLRQRVGKRATDALTGAATTACIMASATIDEALEDTRNVRDGKAQSSADLPVSPASWLSQLLPFPRCTAPTVDTSAELVQ